MEADSGDEEVNIRLTPTKIEPEKVCVDPTEGQDDDDEDTSRGAWKLPKSKWDDDAAVQRLGELVFVI